MILKRLTTKIYRSTKMGNYIYTLNCIYNNPTTNVHYHFTTHKDMIYVALALCIAYL